MSDQKQPHGYAQIIANFSTEEMALLVQLKRFFECAQGDPEFAAAFNSGSFSPAQLARLQQIGVTFDIQGLAMFWERPELHVAVLKLCGCEPDPIADDLRAMISQAPLIELWLRYVAIKNTVNRQVRKTIFRVPKNPAFDAWRLRRVAAGKSELGHFGHFIDHPILAFELGDGCSVGCWFCAFAAHKLTTNLDYQVHREFFRAIAKSCTEIFGRRQTGMTLLYYGTEPHDNPNYLDYLKDFTEVTGHPTCTSTAVPGDAQWVRSLIAFYRQWNLPWPRFSVLTKAMLHKIHDLYTPEELRDVELLIQTKEHARQKVTGGRILKEQGGMREREEGNYLEKVVPQGSIACVSGFLINLVHRTIKLVSPCYTSQKWPYGYRVYDTATFTAADDFPQVIAGLIARNMPLTPGRGEVARFRDDLFYKPTAQGFDLISPNQVHHFTGKEVLAPLGAMLAAGDRTFEQIYDAMIDTQPINPLLAGLAVKELFDGGFLDEVRTG